MEAKVNSCKEFLSTFSTFPTSEFHTELVGMELDIRDMFNSIPRSSAWNSLVENVKNVDEDYLFKVHLSEKRARKVQPSFKNKTKTNRLINTRLNFLRLIRIIQLNANPGRSVGI